MGWVADANMIVAGCALILNRKHPDVKLPRRIFEDASQEKVGRSRPRSAHLSAGWRGEWRELDGLKAKRFAIRLILAVSEGRLPSCRQAPAPPARPATLATTTLHLFKHGVAMTPMGGFLAVVDGIRALRRRLRGGRWRR